MKHKLAEVELVREHEIGDEFAKILETRTHLGGLLKEGDIVAGYDLNTLSSLSEDLQINTEFQRITKKMKIPDVIIIKKHYSRFHRHRKWKLKALAKEKNEDYDKNDQLKDMQDQEEFYRELEEDKEMRARINIYKHKKDHDSSSVVSDNVDENGQEIPSIPMDELIEEFLDLKIDDGNGDDNNNKNSKNYKSNAMIEDIKEDANEEDNEEDFEDNENDDDNDNNDDNDNDNDDNDDDNEK